MLQQMFEACGSQGGRAWPGPDWLAAGCRPPAAQRPGPARQAARWPGPDRTAARLAGWPGRRPYGLDWPARRGGKCATGLTQGP